MSTVAVTGPAAVAGPELEIFVQRPSRPRVLAHLRSPLGIYTVPLLLGVLWQVASWQGWISAELASSPAQIVRAGASLWRQGLLIGLTAGTAAATLAGLHRGGEQAFNGVVQILNTGRPVAASQIVANLLPAGFTTR